MLLYTLTLEIVLHNFAISILRNAISKLRKLGRAISKLHKLGHKFQNWLAISQILILKLHKLANCAEHL